MSDLFLLSALALLAWGGYKVAAVGLEILDLDLAKAMGLPLGLLGLTLACVLGAGWIPLPWILALSLIICAALGFFLRVQPNPDAAPPPFLRRHKWLLGLIILGSLFYVHSTQLINISPDFWYSYPLSRSLIKGNFQGYHPFFPQTELNGHLSHPLLTATLSYLVDCDTLRGLWILELALSLGSILLWALVIRQISGQNRAGAWGALLLFMGINVGGKAGLMDSFENGDLLVFAVLGVLLGLLVDIIYKARAHWPLPWYKILLTALIAGAYGLLCETYLVLVLACFGAGCLIVCRRRTSIAPFLSKIAALIIGGSLFLSSCLGGFLGHAVRHWASTLLAPTHPQYAQSLERSTLYHSTAIKFPKEHFLAIRLGVDPYQRYSGALDTALFRNYRPLLDDGGYSSVFSSKVLVLHWLPTWLAPLTIWWAIYRRSICGYMFGLLGLGAYFTPALFDFGPILEAEYFRWEFMAGLAFSGLLALTLSDLWEQREHLPKAWKRWAGWVAIILLILANLVGAQRLLNNIVIAAQKDPHVASQVLWPWYPPTREWLLSNPHLQLNRRDLDLAQWLWESEPQLSILWRQHPCQNRRELLKCAAINGWAGTLSCEHALPPSWLPLGSPPYLPNSNTTSFKFSGDPTLIAGLGARWLVVEEPLEERYLERLAPSLQGKTPAITLEATFGQERRHWLYQIRNALSPQEAPPARSQASSLELKAEGLPSAGQWVAGQAYPLQISSPSKLEGWLQGVFSSPAQNGASRPLPWRQWLAQTPATIWLAPPLDEGDYQLQWYFSADGKRWQKLSQPLAAPYSLSENIDENLRLAEVRFSSPLQGELILTNIGSQPFQVGGPLQIKWWVWSAQLHNYRTGPLEPEGENTLRQAIPPGGKVAIPWHLDSPLPPGGRLDVSASAPLGQNVTIARQ